MQHTDPQKAERRDRVGAAGGPGGLRRTVHHAGVVERVERLDRQPRVARNGVGYQRFDPGVADVLELLPVGGVHKGLVGVDLCGAPTDPPDSVQLGIVADETGPLDEGIAGLEGCEPLQRHRLCAGLDAQLDETPGPPPKGEIVAMGSPFQAHSVRQPQGLAVVHRRPIGQPLPVRPVERLCIGDLNFSAESAAGHQLRIGR